MLRNCATILRTHHSKCKNQSAILKLGGKTQAHLPNQRCSEFSCGEHFSFAYAMARNDRGTVREVIL